MSNTLNNINQSRYIQWPHYCTS